MVCPTMAICEDFLDQLLFAGGRSGGGVELESVVDDPAQCGFVAAHFGRDVFVLGGEDALLVGLGNGCGQFSGNPGERDQDRSLQRTRSGWCAASDRYSLRSPVAGARGES